MPRKNDFYSFKALVTTLLLSTASASEAAGELEIKPTNKLAQLGQSPAINSDYLKLYAHSRLINDEQYQCFHKLITKESNWRVNARNGSHYGIGQMRNKRYGKLDGFSQVDWSIRYITKRYGSMCNAWRFFIDKGYH